MDILCCALALLGGVIGAGFASGREIVRFFAAHGAMGLIAVAFALAALLALFALLPIRLAAEGQTGLSGLCRARFGARVGGVCGALFFLLSAVTGGAMLAACAELSALVWPIRHAYALGFAVTAVLAALLCAFETRGLAVVGGALCGLLPILLIRLLLLPPGEACFLPEGPPDAVLRAALDGTLYAALNAAMMAGAPAHAADPVRAAAAGVRRARRPALRRHADAGHARLSAPDAERAPCSRSPSSGSAAASARAAICSSRCACMRRRCPPCAPCSAQ